MRSLGIGRTRGFARDQTDEPRHLCLGRTVRWYSNVVGGHTEVGTRYVVGVPRQSFPLNLHSKGKTFESNSSITGTLSTECPGRLGRRRGERLE